MSTLTPYAKASRYGYRIRQNRTDGSYSIIDANRNVAVAYPLSLEMVREFFADPQLRRTY